MSRERDEATSAEAKSARAQVVCRLPSGQVAVCSAVQCVADGGTIESKIIDTTPVTPTGVRADELFLYTTPNGINVVGTFANSQTDRGEIVGRWLGPLPNTTGRL